MHKFYYIVALILVMSQGVYAQRWDRQMQVKRMSIRVCSDAFTATSFIEMEFYNPGNTELEGLYSFELEPGQAITAFQLDLFGQFRDGSIEEKWKATNAYNTIVGKRIDPALLTMDYANHYSLRIYPVPANGSRRITMTVQQLLNVINDTALYKLPLQIKDTVGEMLVEIQSAGSSGYPIIKGGLLDKQVFTATGKNFSLHWLKRSVSARLPLTFSIPLKFRQPVFALKENGSKSFFALRLPKNPALEYSISPAQLTVYWDVSASGSKRMIGKEIDFLKLYVEKKKVKQLSIITFNHRLQDTAVFYTGGNFNSRWTEYLAFLKYEGATDLGMIDLSQTQADAVFLFSDGHSSFGKQAPKPGQAQVYSISSGFFPDADMLEKISGQTGGCYIDLATCSISNAVNMSGNARDILLRIIAGKNEAHIDQDLSYTVGGDLLLSGYFSGTDIKNVECWFGNNRSIHVKQPIAVTEEKYCNPSGIDRVRMLQLFEVYTKGYWYDVLDFGKKEAVVTTSTAFIVLERLEDYIKFNIMPPPELRSKCDTTQFIIGSDVRRKRYKEQSTGDILTGVARVYNDRMKWWGVDRTPIRYSEKEGMEGWSVRTDAKPGMANAKEESMDKNGLWEDFSGSEVVVTALGIRRRSREVGYSSMIVHDEYLSINQPGLAQALSGKVSGLTVYNNSSSYMFPQKIVLRGSRSVIGANEALIVVDEVPVPAYTLNFLNPNEVESVTIIKGGTAAVLFGANGTNGAIHIRTRKGNWYRGFTASFTKLKNQADVEYLLDIKMAPRDYKRERYIMLKEEYGMLPGFYIDMADYFFKLGYIKDAENILFSAADLTNGSLETWRSIISILLEWKQYDQAIDCVNKLLVMYPDDIRLYRELGLLYTFNRQYQLAVDKYYKGIITDPQIGNGYYFMNFKATMLQEMNSIIALHRDELDISTINQSLFEPLPVDIRIVLDDNSSYTNFEMTVREPDGNICRNETKSNASGKIWLNSNYYASGTTEYQAKNAKPGKYKVRVRLYGYGYENGSGRMIRMLVFRNFGRPGQTIEVRNIMMDNQKGEVEIAEIDYN